MISLIEEFKAEYVEKNLYSNIFCILGFAFGYSLHVDNPGSLFTLCCCYKKDIDLKII